MGGHCDSDTDRNRENIWSATSWKHLDDTRTPPSQAQPIQEHTKFLRELCNENMAILDEIRCKAPLAKKPSSSMITFLPISKTNDPYENFTPLDSENITPAERAYAAVAVQEQDCRDFRHQVAKVIDLLGMVSPSEGVIQMLPPRLGVSTTTQT